MTTGTIPTQAVPVVNPNLTDLMQFHKLEIFASLNCVKVGKIVSFDGTKKTAVVQIAFKMTPPGGEPVSYTPLLDCPVFTLSGGGARVQMPVAAGDPCIVLFSDRSLDDWFLTGAQAAPANPRMHHLSDGIALVGISYLNDGSPATPTNKMVLSYAGTSLSLGASGVSFDGTGSSEIDMAGGIITLKNGTTTLLTLMNLMFAAIEAIQVTGNLPLTAPSVTALEAVKTQMAALLG